MSEYADFMREYTSGYDTDVMHYPYSLPAEAIRWRTTDEMMREVESSGSNFFRPNVMKVWRSRLADGMTGVAGEAGGIFFVTSEKNFDGTKRIYSVRWTYRSPDTKMIQISRFDWEGATLAQARAFAKRAAKAVATHKVEAS